MPMPPATKTYPRGGSDEGKSVPWSLQGQFLVDGKGVHLCRSSTATVGFVDAANRDAVGVQVIGVAVEAVLAEASAGQHDVDVGTGVPCRKQPAICPGERQHPDITGLVADTRDPNA